jgi:hypothetical protein
VKPSAILAISLACGLSLQAQKVEQAVADTEEELPIPSAVFIPPPPPKEVPPMKVEAATTRKLPTHQITVIRSGASSLPDIPPPPEPKPFVQVPVGKPNRLLSFGATVYDHRLSHVKWYNPRTKQNIEAWCAWDWTLLSPLSIIKAGEQVSSFHLFSSNIDTSAGVRFGKEFKIPEHPELAEGAFSVTKGDENEPETLNALIALRDYYFKHKDRLILIQKAREEYLASAAAWHDAHPPKVENHTFWLKPHRGSRYLMEKGGAR